MDHGANDEGARSGLPIQQGLERLPDQSATTQRSMGSEQKEEGESKLIPTGLPEPAALPTDHSGLDDNADLDINTPSTQQPTKTEGHERNPVTEAPEASTTSDRTDKGTMEGHDEAHNKGLKPMLSPKDVDSWKFESQLYNIKANLSGLDKFADHHANDRATLRRILDSEHVLAPMPQLLADVEKARENVKVNPQTSGPLGYYTDLAINSLGRHLDRLRDEKAQLEKLNAEMRRLRAIETQWSILRKYEPERTRQAGPRQDPMPKDVPSQEAPGQTISNALQQTSTAAPGAAASQPVDSEGRPTEYASSPKVAKYHADADLFGYDPDVTVPQLNRLEWADFKAARELNKIRSPSAIDILDGEPAISFSRDRNPGLWWLSAVMGDETKPKKPPAPPKVTLIPGEAPLPERIRINSSSIAAFFTNILWDQDEDIAQFQRGSVMIRPFKVLLYLDRQIRERFSEDMARAEGMTDKETLDRPNKPVSTITELQSQTVCGQGAGAFAVDSMDKDQLGSDLDDPEFTLKEMQEIKCLIDFMDMIKEKTDYVRSEKCQKISFPDLWYLFEPGDEIIDQSRSQAYRIVGVTGVAHKVIQPWRTFNEGEVSPDEVRLTLRCVHIDFDGRRLGPVSKTFTIPRYNGEKHVTSLPAYPLRYGERHGDSRGVQSLLRERLIERGKIFLDVTTDTFKHMHYSGLTLDTGDEVDSHVVVDFKEASIANFGKQTLPRLENLIHGQAQTQDHDTGNDEEACDADCCENETVLDDNLFERTRNQNYIAKLIPEDDEPPPAIYPRDAPELKVSRRSFPESDLIIMSYRVYGFVLRTRKWVRQTNPAVTAALLDLGHLGPPVASVQRTPRGPTTQPSSEENLLAAQGAEIDTDIHRSVESTERETAFDQLVLPKGHKRMLLSLIAQHFRDKESSSKEGTGEDEQLDIVRGKGKGLIILLHGAPGVGKTSTAEGLAELFEKPLFQITCGDLGTTAEEVDTALGTNFSLANKWDCVLLLDEADVFLASRSKEDFVRNGLVSVFLRVLEYYAGILFLTTNRIGDFDEAFTSRIHISLYYPQLQLEPTKEIFTLNFRLIEKRFRKKSKKIKIDEAEILKYIENYWHRHSKERWNGRQIRNACQTALALAEFDAQGGSYEKVRDANAEVRLEVDHLETVSTAYLGFMEYLSKVRDKDDERWAKAMRIRAREQDINVYAAGDQPRPPPTSASQIGPGDPHATTMPPSQSFQPTARPPDRQSQSAAQPQTGAYPSFPWPYPWPPGYVPQAQAGPAAFPAASGPGAQTQAQGPRQDWSNAPPAQSWPGYSAGYGAHPPAG